MCYYSVKYVTASVMNNIPKYANTIHPNHNYFVYPICDKFGSFVRYSDKHVTYPFNWYADDIHYFVSYRTHTFLNHLGSHLQHVLFFYHVLFNFLNVTVDPLLIVLQAVLVYVSHTS